MTAATRKAISKATRFEVLKRDKFTCQYCGKSAPDVILEIDHIVPVANGGKNDIMNLVTACRDCNRGKTSKRLDDNSTIMIQKKQLNDIQERREQLELMVKWRQSLNEEFEIEVDAIRNFLSKYTSGDFTKFGEFDIRKQIKRFGFNEVYTACEIAIDQYYKGDDDSLEHALSKIGGICYNRKHGRYFPSVGREFDFTSDDIDNMSTEEKTELYRKMAKAWN